MELVLMSIKKEKKTIFTLGFFLPPTVPWAS